MAVTVAEVQRIIQYDTTAVPDVQPFIDDAVVLATAVIGSHLTTERFDLVCRYLAAHLIGITDPRIQSEQVKSLQASYQNKLSDGLGITHFGSMAMLLDTSGKLANWNKAVISGKAGAFAFFHAGTNSSDSAPEVY
jgi:energy-converting hydrogenase Eha subunit H